MEAAEMSAREDEAAAETVEERGGFGSLGSIIFLLVLTWAAGIASFPLNDNSFFTHLATGRLILDERSVPSTDPYTFTAFGEPWTVQSWLASVAYAGFERVGGDVGLRVLLLTVFLVAMSILWRLTRPVESMISRFLLMASALFIVTDLWSERPYMIGVIGLGLVWIALEGGIRPWLLVPFMWVWVNTHGSWPLAIALVALYLAGSVLDRRASARSVSTNVVERRVGAGVVLGAALGAIGPLGPKVLWFPITAMSKSDVFSEIIEWRPPTYLSIAERVFLIVVVAVMVQVPRAGRWRLVLPSVAFAAAGLYAQRNIVMATVVLLAALARTLPDWGTLRSGSRPAVGRPALVALAALFVVVCLVTLLTPALPGESLAGYPDRALQFLGAQADEPRIAAEASTGNLFEVLDGPRGAVFADDRVDMLPASVFDDFLRLSRGRVGWDRVLDRYQVDLAVWKRDAPISSLLAADQSWVIIYSDSRSLIACRRGNSCARSEER